MAATFAAIDFDCCSLALFVALYCITPCTAVSAAEAIKPMVTGSQILGSSFSFQIRRSKSEDCWAIASVSEREVALVAQRTANNAGGVTVIYARRGLFAK